MKRVYIIFCLIFFVIIVSTSFFVWKQGGVSTNIALLLSQRGELTVDNTTLRFSYPRLWKLAEGGDTSNDPKFRDNALIVSAPDIEKKDALVLIRQYDTEEGTGIPVASFGTISLVRYPEKIQGDSEDVFLGLSAKEKERVYAPLFMLYKNRSIDGIVLEQHRNDGPRTSAYYGGWWGNNAAYQDRIGVQYIESGTGEFRGVAYFMNQGQDITFNPEYHVVLIKPDERLVFELNLPIGSKEFNQFIYRGEENFNDEQHKLTQDGYEYLSSKRFSPEVKKLVAEIDGMIASLRLK